MSDKIKQKRQAIPIALGMTYVLSACGGGATSTSSVADSNAAAAPMQLSGTIVVEERNGKTVLDGWFVQSVSSDMSAATGTPNLTDDNCLVESVNVDSVLAAANGPSENSWSDLQAVDGSAGIESRAGQYDSLVKQESGDTIVYAPSERWNSDALPDDAVLSFDSDTTYGEIGAVDVLPLTPLVWLTPDTGVMSSAAETLNWEATLNEDVRINLKLSAIDFRDSENPTVTSINCQLVDDGVFTLSPDMQQQLPNDHSGIVVYAVRERVQQIESNDTSLTVVQLSYPAPVKR